MANETLYANGVNVAAYVESRLATKLRNQLVTLALVNLVPFVRGSDSKKQGETGSVTATAGAEATTHANSSYSQTALPTLQVQEAKVLVRLSNKAEDYSNISLEEIVDACRFAVGDYVDSSLLSQTQSLTNTVGATGTDLSLASIRQGVLKLDQEKVDGQRAAILAPKQISEIADAIENSTKTVWSNTDIGLSILSGQAPAVNGLKGYYLDIPIFSSNNIPDDSTDYSGILGNIKKTLSFGEDGRGIIVEEDRDIVAGTRIIVARMFFDAKLRQNKASVEVLSQIA